MTKSVTRPCFPTQHHTCMTKMKNKTDFWSHIGLVLRPTVSDHITHIISLGHNCSVMVFWQNHFLYGWIQFFISHRM